MDASGLGGSTGGKEADEPCGNKGEWSGVEWREKGEGAIEDMEQVCWGREERRGEDEKDVKHGN